MREDMPISNKNCRKPHARGPLPREKTHKSVGVYDLETPFCVADRDVVSEKIDGGSTAAESMSSIDDL